MHFPLQNQRCHARLRRKTLVRGGQAGRLVRAEGCAAALSYERGGEGEGRKKDESEHPGCAILKP